MDMFPMKHNVRKIGTILESVLKDINAYDNVNKLLILSNWNDLVDPKISRVCRAVKFEKDVLILEAISESWKNELISLKPQIIRILKEKFNQLEIKEIKIV